MTRHDWSYYWEPSVFAQAMNFCTTDLPSCMTGKQVPRVSASGARIVRIADLEKEAILAAIAQLNGDKLRAAQLLGIGKTTLYRKLKQYGTCSSANL